MQMLIEYLGSLSAGAVLGWIVAIVLAAIAIYKCVEAYRKARNKYDATQEQSENNEHEIKNIRNDMTIMKQESDEKFEKLHNQDVEILGKLDEISDFMVKTHDYQKKKDVHDLKDRIEKSFRAYQKRAEINNGKVFLTQNELESLEGVIESYEDAGGNSFVHTNIKPAILTWQVVSEEEFIRIMRAGAGEKRL